MTGAGAATIAYALEDSYLGGVTSPTYYQPGPNLTVEDIELSNVLERIRDPDDVESQLSLAQNLEGAFAATWTLENDSYHNILFNNGSDDGWVTGPFPSAEWYIGLQYGTNTVERVLQGAVMTDLSIRYRQNQPVRVNATFVYGDELTNTSITPGTINRSGDPVAHHGAEVRIDGLTQQRLQSATLSYSPLGRLQRGTDRQPAAAVMGAVNPTLSVEGIFTETDQLELAYGTSGATATQDTVGGTTGAMEFASASGTVVDYEFSDLTANTYAWNGIGDADADKTETATFHINGVTVV